MNRIVFTFFACLIAVSLSAQTVELPYNPDSNADQYIGAPDLLDFLPTFGEPFVVGELMVDGMTLEQYLIELSDGVTMVGVELLSDTILTFTFSNDSVATISFPQGITGPQGLQGPPGPQGDTGDDGADGATGSDGLSAYQIWLSLGNTGSEQDFIDALSIEANLPTLVGCADVSACNFNPAATANYPALCLYADACGVCDGPGAIYGCGCTDIPEGDCDCNGVDGDADGDGICDTDEILGCPFANACNYNPVATEDDGSCIFYCPGCTDETACNYDSGAIQDDGSCEYPVDLSGIDYIDCFGECLSDEDDDGVCLEDEVYGCTESGACNYDSGATEEDESCEYVSCAGCMDEGACNFDFEATMGDDSCEYDSCAGCLYEFACNYDPEATIADNGSCEFGTCPGCTDPEACNYNPTVTEDEGSCVYYGDSGYDCEGLCLLPWTQQGADIDGEAAYDNSGRSVSLSSDGSTVAIAAPYNDGNGNESGHVRIYTWNGSSWAQQGADIDGEAASDFSGWSVSLSSDGSTVAIGTYGNDGNGNYSGHVRIYAWSGSSWTQQGADIDGEAAYDNSGMSVSLSSDGSTVAIGAIGDDGNGDNSGHVRIYAWSGSSWAQQGADIDGEAAGDYSGMSVSLSSDGNTVAIGAGNNDGNGDNSGHVRIYAWSGSSWTQQGADIDGEAAGDESGYSVSLSSDGSTVAIGAYRNDGNGTYSGHVRIYAWGGNSWTQQGADIDGEAANDFSGRSVSLSSDGSTVAIGAYGNDGNSFNSNSGHVRIYAWSGSSWTQQGADIDGEVGGDESGSSVSLSSDGSTVAIGAPYNNYNSSGHVRIYASGCE